MGALTELTEKLGDIFMGMLLAEGAPSFHMNPGFLRRYKAQGMATFRFTDKVKQHIQKRWQNMDHQKFQGLALLFYGIEADRIVWNHQADLVFHVPGARPLFPFLSAPLVTTGGVLTTKQCQPLIQV